MKLPIVLVVLALALPAAPARPAGPLTDPQIASILVTANEVDVQAGKVAASRTGNAEVRSFAELMIADHGAVNRAAIELVRRLGITPQESPTSESLKRMGEENVAHLRTLTGAISDAAYVGHEVEYHQLVIDTLDRQLIPSASNAELRALLVKTRPSFVAHLEHAKKLRATLPPR